MDFQTCPVCSLRIESQLERLPGPLFPGMAVGLKGRCSCGNYSFHRLADDVWINVGFAEFAFTAGPEAKRIAPKVKRAAAVTRFLKRFWFWRLIAPVH